MRFDLSTRSFVERETDSAKLAVAGADGELSWAGLEKLSDHICELLIRAKLPANYPVCVYGNKEIFFLASLLSCYRMRQPFIPVTPELPLQRILTIAELVGSEVILANNKPAGLSFPVHIDDATVHGELTSRDVNLPATTAYVLFTSGSTGTPKGICISNDNLKEFGYWFVQSFPVTAQTVCMNQASFLFDISLADLFGILHAGGTAVFNTSEMIRNGSLQQRLRDYKVNYWNSTPSFLNLIFIDRDFQEKNYPSINCFTLSGEELTANTARELQKRFPAARIFNAYGPTETTIFASRCEIKDEMLPGERLPIAEKTTAEISVVHDEIVITSRVGSYLNGDTSAFTVQDGKKVFLTGDRGFVHDSYLYFAGRMDDQVKLNGYRIELGEIKNALEKMPGVQAAECTPVVVKEKVQRIIAFVLVNKNSSGLTSAILKEKISAELPSYMIPAEIVIADKFPYTNSFKIDRAKLLHDYLSA